MMSDDKICAAYVAAFAEIEAATKSATNPHFKSKYADLPAVVDAIKPHLAKHGLGFMQCPRPADGGVAIETILIHAEGGKISMGVLFVPANKQDAHGYGSALTYARRYALQTCFGLPTEDDDGNAAVASSKKSDPIVISPDKLSYLQGLIDSTGTDIAALCKHYKVNALVDLTPEKYAAAVKVLENKVSQ
jgi:hypothetical protein